MALFDDLVNGGNLWTGLAIGALFRLTYSSVGPVLRPIAKTAIKGGLIAYREAEQLYNDATQGIAEMAQEAQQEIGATTAAQSHTDRSTPSTI
jgi:hypothetical protein